MRKYTKTIFAISLLWIVIGASSCFDIFEEYIFNADGSGTASFTIDMAKMVEMIESFGAMGDSTESEDNSVDEMFADNETVGLLRQIPGISKVQDLNNREEKIIGYAFEFASVDALNDALIASKDNMGMAGMMGVSPDAENDAKNFFQFKGKKFSRVMELKMPEDKNASEEDKQYIEMAMMMFEGSTYSVRYSFPSAVKKLKKNPNAFIETDGKSVSVECSLSDVLKGKAQMNTEIKIK